VNSIITKQTNNLVTIVLPSSFDVSQYEEFKAICKEYEADDNRFEEDFTVTQYMDSSALGMLLLLREQVKGDKERVLLTNVTGTTLKILEIAQFNQLFNIS